MVKSPSVLMRIQMESSSPVDLSWQKDGQLKVSAGNLSSKEVTATGSRCGQPSQREAEKPNWKGAGGRLACGGLQTFQPLLKLAVYLKKIERYPLLHAWLFIQHHQPHLHPRILHTGRSLACTGR